jgi:pimeloyl-ACP methyl ester carboxylesterase
MTVPRSFLLIPGAGGAAWYWHRVVAALEAGGHDAVAVDLPAEDDTAGWQEYVGVAVSAAGYRTDLVVVGQSMGAFTASLLPRVLPVSLLVLVNAMIPAPGETGGDWWGNTGQAEAQRENDAREGRPVNAEFDVTTLFLHDVPEPVRSEAARYDRGQSMTPFTQPWPRDSWPDVPTRVVSGRDDRLFPVDFQRRVAQDRLGIVPDVVPGGHLVALSRPEGLVHLLASYAEE